MKFLLGFKWAAKLIEIKEPIRCATKFFSRRCLFQIDEFHVKTYAGWGRIKSDGTHLYKISNCQANDSITFSAVFEAERYARVHWQLIRPFKERAAEKRHRRRFFYTFGFGRSLFSRTHTQLRQTRETLMSALLPAYARSRMYLLANEK